MAKIATAWTEASTKQVTSWSSADDKLATNWEPNYGKATYDTLGTTYDDALYTYDAIVRQTKLPTVWGTA